MSTSLRETHRNPMTPSSAVDDIPFLTRALSQIHTDSTRMLAARGASKMPSANVHAPAIRLFSALGFEVDRLRRAISTLESASVFLDSPVRPVPPFQTPSWLTPRAIDDARLALNAALRNADLTVLDTDLALAKDALVDSLSKLYPIEVTPVRTRMRTSMHSPTPTSTPGANNARRPRTPTSAGSLTPAIAALPIPEGYISATTAIALRGESLSAPALMHEAAVNADDAPHFVYILDILMRVSRFPQSTKSTEEMFIWASRTALEDQFAATISGLPDSPRSAAPQAVIPPIEEFVKNKFSNSSRLSRDGTPARPSIWPFVFYCLRVGSLSTAIHLLRRSSSVPAGFFEWFTNGREEVRQQFVQNHFKDADNHQNMVNFPDDLPMVAGCLSNEDMYETVAKEFRSATLSGDDPYMRACYVLLLRLELRSMAPVASPETTKEGMYLFPHKISTADGKHERFSMHIDDRDFEEVFSTVEDYLWLKLWLCRTESEQSVMEVLPNSSFLTLSAFQSEILSCGEAHFDPDGAQPLLCAFVLSASIQFERAIMYLYDHHDEHWLHYAVHLAMVLYHKGWISSGDWYERMIARYVEQVAKHSVVDGALYILTLRNGDRVVQFLTELTTKSGEYDLLLGHSGKEDGVIAALLASGHAETPSKFEIRDLTKVRDKAGKAGAVEAISRGELTRAAELLETAGRKQEALEIRIRDAANEVHRLSSGRRSGVMLAARRALSELPTEDLQGSVGEELRLKKSFTLLLKMGASFEDYWTGRYAASWQTLREIELIPMSGTEVTASEKSINDYSRWWMEPGRGLNVSHSKSVTISECIVELVKVALHIAEYALESGSARVDKCQSPMGQDGKRVSVPHINEIRTVTVFATMMRCDDKMMDERLSRVEALLADRLSRFE